MRRLLVAILLGLLAGCGTPPPAPDAVVTGVALSRERVVLPPEAVFEAALLDVSDPDAPPVVLGRQRREPAGNPPYALRIPYPTARFLPKGRYEVRAAVTLDGRLLLATGLRHPVPQEAAYRHVDVQLQRLPLHPATLEAGLPLALTYWRLAEIEGEAVPRSAEGAPQPHLVLQSAEARASGSGGCNRFLAGYALEERFFAALAGVEGFRQQGTQLLLRDAEGKALLRFEAAETPLR